jgi:hypothetical protein
MARQRSTKQKGSETVSEQVNAPNVNTPTNAKVGERKMAMTGLDADFLKGLLASTRTKGDYVIKLNQFVESGENGICANDTWMELADKKDSTLKQGFENAKSNKEAHDDAQYVKVIANEGKVYLINLKDAAQAAEAEAAEAA